MITITIFNSFIVLLAYFSSFKGLMNLFKLAFLLLLVTLTFRYDFGNDYLAYEAMFTDVNNHVTVEIEVGWYYFNRICSFISFYGLIALWSLIYIYVLYRFIVQYVPRQWYWLALFILLFDPYNLLVHTSMLRQGMAIVLFVFAFDFLLNKKIWPYVITILCASSVHTSALILLPLIVFTYWNVRFNKKWTIILLGFFGGVLACIEPIKTVLLEWILGLAPNYLDAYMGQEKILGQGRAVMIKVIILAVCLWYQKCFTSAGLLASKLFYIGYFFIPLATIVLMMTRLGQYFLIFGVILIPITASVCRNKIVLYSFLFLVFFITLYDYFNFFYDPTWIEKYSTYKSIFSLI